MAVDGTVAEFEVEGTAVAGTEAEPVVVATVAAAGIEAVEEA